MRFHFPLRTSVLLCFLIGLNALVLAKHIIAAGERPQGALTADIAANQNADSTPGRSLERRAFKDINTKDPDVKYGTYYAELSEPAYGLWIWSNLARNMRVSLRNGGTHIPFPANTSSNSDSLDITQFYSQPVLMYLIPLFIFLGTLLLTCLTTFLNGCCILCCRKRRLGRRQKDPFTGRQKGCAIFGLAFVSLAWCAAIAGGLSGSDYFGKSITILKVSADKIFQDTSDTFSNVNNVVDNTFKYILTTVNGTADNVTALIPMDSANAVATSINTMADSCDATKSSLQILQTASTAFQGRKDSLSANSGLVASTITALNLIKNSVDSLNAYQTAPGRTEPYRISYATTDPITTDLESTRTAMQSWQSLSQIINTVVQNMPDLASIASASRNAGSNFTQQVLLLTTEPTAAIKKTAQDQLSPVQNDISDQFASIKASISDKQDQFNQYTPYITQGQTYSWITGEVCTIAFDRSVNGTAPMVDLLKMVMGNDTANSYSKAMAARESCLQGDPIMTAINMFVDTSKFDVVSGATSAIMSLSLGDITGSLDLTSILGTNKSPTSATTLADNLVSELSQYSTDDIAHMKLAVNNANAALGATLSSLRNPATDPDLQMQSGTASADERGFALTDLQNRIDAIRTSISDLQAATGSLGQARAALDALTDPSTDFADIMTKANSFDSYADHITPNFQDVATKIANFVSDADAKVTAGVPTLQANMISAVTIARDKIMKMDVKCQNLATDTVNLEMGMCDGLLTGGDAFWFAFFILCSGGAMSVPVFISAANMLADRESGRPKGETGSGKTKKAFDTGKPTEKGKGKGKDDVEAGQIKWNAPGANSPGGGPGEHFQVSKSAALSPTDVEPKSPERNSQPDSARIYPEVEPHLPGYNAEGGVHRAPSDAKKPFSMSGPSGTGSPHASPRVSQQGAPHSYGNAASQRQSVQMHAYAPEDDDIQEMRPSWLGGGGGGSAGPSVHDGEISGSFSPRARHPYQPVSPADSYLDSTPDGNGAPQQQYAHPHPPAANNSRRVSAAQHPEYEHVVSEFSKRVSQQPPAHVYDDRGYQVPPPQPYYEQPEQPHYGDDQHYDEYGRPRY